MGRNGGDGAGQGRGRDGRPFWQRHPYATGQIIGWGMLGLDAVLLVAFALLGSGDEWQVGLVGILFICSLVCIAISPLVVWACRSQSLPQTQHTPGAAAATAGSPARKRAARFSALMAERCRRGSTAAFAFGLVASVLACAVISCWCVQGLDSLALGLAFLLLMFAVPLVAIKAREVHVTRLFVKDPRGAARINLTCSVPWNGAAPHGNLRWYLEEWPMPVAFVLDAVPGDDELNLIYNWLEPYWNGRLRADAKLDVHAIPLDLPGGTGCLLIVPMAQLAFEDDAARARFGGELKAIDGAQLDALAAYVHRLNVPETFVTNR